MEKQEREAMGRRLKAIRERAHISIEEAAQAVGVQPLAVEKWERGRALPSLLELRALLPVYGVMACEVLYDSNPLSFTEEEAQELFRVTAGVTPRLRARIDYLLTLMGKGKEPIWKRVA